MNFMGDDVIRKRVSKHKTDFDKVRKSIRKIQQEQNKKNIYGPDSIEMEDLETQTSTKQERVLLQNRRHLEEAKSVGLECDDMARDIKFNLQSQSHKLENSTLKNLYEIQKDTVLSSRLIKSIKAARFKNKLIMCGIIILLILSILFVAYMSVRSSAPSTPTETPPTDNYDNQNDL